MPKLRSAPQQAHRKAVESNIADVVGYLQEVLGQKLVAHVAGVSDPRTVARWAAGERAPRAEHEQRYGLFWKGNKNRRKSKGQ